MPDQSAIVFGVLAVMLLGSAMMMLISRNIVHSAYWLLAVAVETAAIFAFLNAGYVALIQLMVYAGAVSILTIFTIMITMRRPEDAIRQREFSGGSLALALTFFLLVGLAVFGSPEIAQVSLNEYPSIEAFGKIMFAPGGWSLPFEIASLILTTALVAAIMWSKESDEQ